VKWYRSSGRDVGFGNLSVALGAIRSEKPPVTEIRFSVPTPTSPAHKPVRENDRFADRPS
jgi:hypothetical protein